MLTEEQKAAARKLLATRPETLPGTRAIYDAQKASVWHHTVSKSMVDNMVRYPNDIKEFCDIAGVAD